MLQEQKLNPILNVIESHWRVSIPRPADYKSAALPAELQWQVKIMPKANQ